jgi:hypothetical protein
MSDEKARARRMMRLSELHARANKWREEEGEDEADPAAEFERTGRLPPEPSKPSTSSVEDDKRRLDDIWTKYPSTLSDFVAVAYFFNGQTQFGAAWPFSDPIDFRKWINGQWLRFWIGFASIIVSVYLLLLAAHSAWPWWSRSGSGICHVRVGNGSARRLGQVDGWRCWSLHGRR